MKKNKNMLLIKTNEDGETAGPHGPGSQANLAALTAAKRLAAKKKREIVAARRDMIHIALAVFL